jgi:putative N6-adenine-specific DNA methylase
MTQPQLRKGRPGIRHRFFAATASGLEPALLAEMQALGLEELAEDSGGVFFSGPMEACYRANLWLRSASRVLRIVARVPCSDEATLYKQVYAIDWHALMEVDQTLAVRVRFGQTGFTNSQFMALKIKDAIVDRFRDTFGKRPSVNKERPDVQIQAYVHLGHCTLALDSSGPPLFMRGYREGEAKAPLKETLAAGLVGLTGWQADRPFYDVFCGSGTLPIEAAMLAGKRAPGLNRERFGFENWPDYHAPAFQKEQARARSEARPIPVRLFASDRDPKAIAAARANARRAGVEDAITFATRELADFAANPEAGSAAEGGLGMILSNPPYGDRMGDMQRLAPLYKEIGDTLKHKAKGMEAFIFTAHGELIKSIGLRPSRRVILRNGPIECRLLRFEMY